MPKRTISFVGTVTANSTKILVSKEIAIAFTILELRSSFALNQARTVQISYFLSPDPEAPSTGEPTGINLMRTFGQVDYLVGDDEQKIMPVNVNVPDVPVWLKIYAKNTDGFNHDIDCQIIIEY